MPERHVAGWDLGGAHLKLAVAKGNGALLEVIQLPCPLWQGLDRLERAIGEARARLPERIERHGVTMTGELVDLFPNRTKGVGQLVDTMTGAFPDSDLRIYGGRAGFLTPGDALGQPEAVASANWLASAGFTAKRLGEALFMDLGSTTTDILPLSGGEVRALGLTDAERLVAEELVYTGITRTPVMVMAMAEAVPFGGERQRVMAEHFATMADVHRLTGRLPEDADQHPAADGGAKSAEASARRLARMLGRDRESAGMDDWQRLAGHLAERQLRMLQDAADRVLSRGLLSNEAPLVGAGVGRFLLADLAARLKRPYRDFAELVRVAKHCAKAPPAVPRRRRSRCWRWTAGSP